MDITNTTCYECKHPIRIIGDQGPVIYYQPTQSDSTMYQDILKANRILQLASSQTQIRQILCLNCLNQLISSLQKILSEASLNKSVLQQQLEAIQQQIQKDDTQQPTIEQIQAKQLQFHSLKQQEKLQNEKFKSLNLQLYQLIQQENQFWNNTNQLERKLLNFQQASAQISQRIKVAQEQYNFLTRINTLNDLFYISSQHQIGSISGLRLGRTDHQIVPWDQINAAWGQVVLLLATLLKLKGFKSAQCNLYPIGSFSRVSAVHDDSSRYELFCSDSILNTMLLRYNTAQSLFLNALYEFSLFMESEDPTIKIPYEISDHTVGDLKILLEGNKDEWTHALKFMLLDLKYLLTVTIRDMQQMESQFSKVF